MPGQSNSEMAESHPWPSVSCRSTRGTVKDTGCSPATCIAGVSARVSAGFVMAMARSPDPLGISPDVHQFYRLYIRGCIQTSRSVFLSCSLVLAHMLPNIPSCYHELDTMLVLLRIVCLKMFALSSACAGYRKEYQYRRLTDRCFGDRCFSKRFSAAVGLACLQTPPQPRARSVDL